MRPLLPAPRQANHSPPGGDLPAGKPKYAKAACESCRKKKMKCTAERPKCRACAARNLECVYGGSEAETRGQALKRKFEEGKRIQNVYEDLFINLQKRPPLEAEEIFGRIRAGDDVESILQHIEHGDLLMQLHLRQENPANVQLPFPAGRFMFIDDPNNLYAQSKVLRLNTKEAPTSLGDLDARDIIYTASYILAELVEPRLQLVKASDWTTVIQDDNLFRRLLRNYFLYSHPSMCFFHKDLFLDDLSEGKHDFCSRLLVNAILDRACHSNRELNILQDFWNPRSLIYQFRAEVRRLWDIERPKAKLTTIQAALVYSYSLNCDGIEKVGRLYESEACDMAQQKDIFSPKEGLSSKTNLARAVTAWAIYAWQGLMHCCFFTPPRLQEPPKYELPEPQSMSEFVGEIWIKYPMFSDPVATNQGLIFQANISLRSIACEIATDTFRQPPTGGPWTSARTLEHYQKLENWFDNLPDRLSPENIALPSDFHIHSYYHHIVINILEFEVAREEGGESTTGKGKEPEVMTKILKLVKRSRTALTTLLRLQYLRHGYDYLDTVTLLPVSRRAFSTINEALKEKLLPELRDYGRATLLMCARRFFESGDHAHVSETVLTTLRNNMTDQDRRILAALAGQKSPASRMRLIAKYIHTAWPYMSEHQDRQLDSMIREMEETDLTDDTASQSPT